MCRIYARADANIADRGEWPKQHRWLIEKLEALHRVFGPRATQLAGPGESAAIAGA